MLKMTGLAKVYRTEMVETYALRDFNLNVREGEFVAVTGPSGSGKTTFLTIAGLLESASSGRYELDGVDVGAFSDTQRSRLRNEKIGFIFQAFNLIADLNVADNIEVPLRYRGFGAAERRKRVREALERVGLAARERHYPAELSGGQQQRVALARALAKGAPLMLLDEPLVNLDYKLREELREELCQLFASGESTVVYTTTEPAEALLLGGWTAVMDQGELLQYGPTAEVFHHPRSIRVARAFSDPPMNLLAAQATEGGLQLAGGPALALALPPTGQAALTVGVRASALRVAPRAGDVALPGSVELAEISGSDTFVHVQTAVGELVAQLTGVHEFDLGAPITLHASPAQVHVFDARGELLLAPQRLGGR